ncbi:hypothetical protein M0R45_010366 [Rubus argutus]|uniref:Uncharacterized protein n=1 Tax=Rubus argutus TaxID=59490 RepID=A0AAW1Y7I5_RUBAR
MLGLFNLAGAREFVGTTRKTGPDDLLKSAIAGFGSGAILGRLYGKFRYRLAAELRSGVERIYPMQALSRTFHTSRLFLGCECLSEDQLLR